MTAKELIEILNKYPDNTEIFFEYDGPDAIIKMSVDEVVIIGEGLLLLSDG